MKPLERAIFRAISDPGLTEGYKGERSLTQWQVDSVMRVLGAGGTFTCQGKQVLRDGQHFADACDDDAAKLIVAALNAA